MFFEPGNASNEELVARLERRGDLRSAKVAATLRALDRKKFCPAGTADEDAYADSPLSIGHGQTISAPHMHVFCLQKLEQHIAGGAAALDVGSGSGFLTAAMALLAELHGNTALRVVGIELLPGVAEFGRRNVAAAQPQLLSSGRVSISCDDAWTVSASLGTLFDAIHVGAAAESVPPSLLALLRPGGRMIIPVGPEHGAQQVVQIDRSQDGTEFKETPLLGVRYVPLVRPR